MAGRCLVFLVLALSLSGAFSIVDYHSEVTVQVDGSLSVYERIAFDLEKEYNEGFRSIRKDDFGTLSDISVSSAKVNGAPVQYAVQMNGQQAEIVWKRTYAGRNVVELNYTIADRVLLFDDFARVCFEHYGANWPVSAGNFWANTTLPPASAGKEMHFEVYSAREGNAHVEDLSIIIEMDWVPSGNYIGGCYLFDRGSVNTTNTVSGSAYAILKQERESYGSKSVLEAERPGAEWYCFPSLIISLIFAAYFFGKERGRPKLPESILPPGKEEPAAVSALVRNRYELKELAAAVLVDLIGRNAVDIVELEKKGGGSPLQKERTILLLKGSTDGLKDYEKSVVNLVFVGGKEVDLDAMMEKYDSVGSRAAANRLPIVEAVKKFDREFPQQIEALLKDEEVKRLSKLRDQKLAIVSAGGIIALGIALFMACSFFVSDLGWYFRHGETLLFYAIAASAIAFPILTGYSAYCYLKADIPKSAENRALYIKWDAFYRGLQVSRINEYPPGSAVIWGEILKYATALGQADKVKRHLSELDSVLASRVEAMDRVAVNTMAYYTCATAIHNLGRYGNRAGEVHSASSHGGFSSFSSGGWSGGGGGGFSGASSGGGGFR